MSAGANHKCISSTQPQTRVSLRTTRRVVQGRSCRYYMCPFYCIGELLLCQQAAWIASTRPLTTLSCTHTKEHPAAAAADLEFLLQFVHVWCPPDADLLACGAGNSHPRTRQTDTQQNNSSTNSSSVSNTQSSSSQCRLNPHLSTGGTASQSAPQTQKMVLHGLAVCQHQHQPVLPSGYVVSTLHLLLV